MKQNQKIRVAYVINRIERGGPGCVLLNLINGIDKSKFSPILITLFSGNNPTIVDSLRKNGIEVVEYNFQSRWRYLLYQYRSLEKVLKNKVNVIHTHGFIPDVSVSRMKGIKKRITTIHNVMIEDYRFEYGWIKGKLFTWIHQMAICDFDAVVGCSQFVYESLKHLPNSTYVRNGIDVEDTYEAERQNLRIPGDATIFIYVGRLFARKNVIELVKLFSKYHGKEDYLLIVGDGPDMKQCRNISDNHVKFLGSQENPIQYMRMSDIFISASRAEGFSISVLEAVSCGLLLFLSDIEPHKEIFSISKGIYLGEYFKTENFGAKLKRLKENIRDKEGIKDFQAEQLSAIAMSVQYQKFYLK